MEKRLLQLLLFCIITGTLWHFWQPFWRKDLNEAVQPQSTDKVIFEVEKGSSAKQIAEELYEEDLIVNATSFKRAVEEEDLDGSLRYGRFVLSPSMTMREVITILTSKGTGEMAFTAPEGWTIKEMDAELTEMGLIGAGAFEDCSKTCSFDYSFLKEGASLEGYLFPDTYFVESAGFKSEDLINMMLKNFDAKFTDEMEESLKNSGRSLKEVLTVASMIEKEVRTSEDRAIVSGIIWKRLDNDWYLGIDATLLYVQEDKELSAEDLADDSPYNTRNQKGLPPTPIGNPGLEAIQAALAPKESEYWFYLTDQEGSVHYAASNAEHEANKELYIK